MSREAIANARLIAAAPGLLAAAKELVRKLDEYAADDLPVPAEVLELEDAIARAEDESDGRGV